MNRKFDNDYFDYLNEQKTEAVVLVNRLSPVQAVLKSTVRSMTKGTRAYIAARRSIRTNRQILRWANRAIRRYYLYCEKFKLFG